MEIIGYFLAIFIGLSLGLVGSGGSILTVPLLVYFFGISPEVATSYSLFIVGSVSGLGAFFKFRKGEVNLRIAILFGLTSIVTVFLTRKFLFPAIPDILLSFGDFQLDKSFALMVLFSLLILFSSIYILKDNKAGKMNVPVKTPLSGLVCWGLVIGLITGLLGAGGGFLIVPVLMFLFNAPIKIAAGTSLAIIASNTLLGWLGDWGQVELDWGLLSKLLLITIIGLVFGMALSRKINGKKLNQAFGWFLMLMALLIMLMEIAELLD